MFNLLLSSEPTYLSDVIEPFAIWGTVGILGALVVAWLIVFLVKRDASSKTLKAMVIGFIVYALVLGILLLVLEISKKFNSGYLEENYVNQDIVSHVFLPLLITAVVALCSVITLFVLSKKKPNAVKSVAIILGAIVFIGIVVSLVMTYKFYSNNIVGDGYYTDDEYGRLNNVALYVSAILLVVGCVLAGLILGKNDKKPFDTKCITIAGVCVALSFALSYIKLFELPFGGSITLFSMFPVMLFAYVYGIKKGLIVGLLYGVLQAIQDPFIIHPAQFLLDYPIAFAMLGFAGALSNLNILSNKPRFKFTLSAILAGVLRWICHVFSGVFAFGAYALDALSKQEGVFAFLTPASTPTKNFWLYSTFYNGYVFVDVILVLIVGVLLFSSKAFTKEVDKLKNPNF